MGFESFLGNSKAVALVRDLLRSGRVPGALLFAGPEGVGKKALALMLAKALNCERRPPGGDDFCGECRCCRKAEEMLAAAREDLARRREIKDATRRVDGLVYFDLQLIEPITRFILIEQVRQLRAVAYTHPFELPRRVFVIDQAQAIHWQAADLLLKVLEEPPETTTIVLVCPNAYELRSTLRSRCLRVQFLPVEEAVVERLLEERGLPKAQRSLASRVAVGSVARAMTFDLGEFQLRRKPWLDYLEAAARAAGDPAEGLDWKALFDATRALSERREDFEASLTMGYTLLRDLLQVLQKGAAAEVINIDLVARMNTWARKLGFAGIERLKNGFDQAYRLQVRNVNQQLSLETLVMDVMVQSPGRP